MQTVAARKPKRGRRKKLEADPSPAPVRPGMTGGCYKPLTGAEMARIHELVLRLLAELGLSQATSSLEARAIAAGCEVDSRGRLRFPRALVEDTIARTRRKFTLHGIDPTHDQTS